MNTTEQNNFNFVTGDINLVAYLIQTGHKVRLTRVNGRWTEFVFDPEVTQIGEEWQFRPDTGMKLIQNFIAEKTKLLDFIKTKQNRRPE